MANARNIYEFSTKTYWESRNRQGNCCASCGDDLGDLPREEAPGHHAGVTANEAVSLAMQNHPHWIRSEENCAVHCKECHSGFAHDGGKFRNALERPDAYDFYKDDPKASQSLNERQEVALANMEAAYFSHEIVTSLNQNGKKQMPSFDDRSKDQTRDNLFGADAGPKAETGPAKMAGGGQGDNNTEKKEQSLQDLQVPKGFSTTEQQKSNSQNSVTTSYSDFIKSIEKEQQQKREQEQEQKHEQGQNQGQERKH